MQEQPLPRRCSHISFTGKPTGLRNKDDDTYMCTQFRVQYLVSHIGQFFRTMLRELTTIVAVRAIFVQTCYFYRA